MTKLGATACFVLAALVVAVLIASGYDIRLEFAMLLVGTLLSVGVTLLLDQGQHGAGRWPEGKGPVRVPLTYPHILVLLGAVPFALMGVWPEPDSRIAVLFYGRGDKPDVWVHLHEGASSGRTAESDEVEIPGEFAQGVVGDFAGSRRDDIFWNAVADTGDEVWLSEGDLPVTPSVGLQVDPQRTFVAGDFTGDFRDDVLTDSAWERHQFSRPQNTQHAQHPDVIPFAGTAVAVGDFNGDGKDDVLRRFELTQSAQVLLGSGLALKPAPEKGVAQLPRGGAIVGEFDDRPGEDILWHAPGAGAVELWLSRGHEFDRTNLTIECPDSFDACRYEPPLVGDFNGDNRSDVFWHHAIDDARGSEILWMSTGVSEFDVDIATVDCVYENAVVVDLDDDGFDDIVWQGAYAGTLEKCRDDDAHDSVWFGTGSEVEPFVSTALEIDGQSFDLVLVGEF